MFWYSNLILPIPDTKIQNRKFQFKIMLFGRSKNCFTYDLYFFDPIVIVNLGELR